MSEIKIKIKVSTNKIGSESTTEFNIDAEEWNEMDEQERADICLDQMFNLIEWNYEVTSEDEN